MATKKTTAENTDTNLKQTIERLRASKAEYEEGLQQSGRAAGVRYANQASYAELKRLDRWCSSVNGDTGGLGSFHQLARILSDEDGSEQDIEVTLRQSWGDDIDDESWIDAFVGGAVSTFGELEPKL